MGRQEDRPLWTDHLDGRVRAGKGCGGDNEENKGEVRMEIRRKRQGREGERGRSGIWIEDRGWAWKAGGR